MKSTDLARFSAWHKWSSDAVRKAPDRPGVYAFRLVGNGFGRLKGESDLVYIGCAASKNGTVSSRLSDHLPSRADGSNVAHRLRDAQKMGNLEVAWGILATPKEAIDEEARLLRKYYGNHLELPPINRCEPAKQTRKILESLTKFVQAENQSKLPSLDDAPTLAENLFRVSGSFSTLRLDLLPRPGRSRSRPNHGTLVVEEMN